VPVLHPPGLEARAADLRDLLETGIAALSEVLDVATPDLRAILVADTDWREAPRESAHPYPPGLPYLTRSAGPPVLVLPAALSPAFEPRTEATWPLVVWHELAHAFLLQRPVPRTPAWLRELLPQALAVAVAKRTSLSLGEHLSRVEREPDLTVRGPKGHANPEEQMAFQNLLLLFGTAALDRFGEGFLRRLAGALWVEGEIVGETKAEAWLADALGPGGREWLGKRPEF
jgi:hypothetical protein